MDAFRRVIQAMPLRLASKVQRAHYEEQVSGQADISKCYSLQRCNP